MLSSNPVRQALTTGQFCYIVELVASRLTREAKLFQAASDLARVPEVVAGSITSYAGGSLGHDPIRVGTAARARGLTPNIHITCVNRDRADILRSLEDLHALVYCPANNWTIRLNSRIMGHASFSNCPGGF